MTTRIYCVTDADRSDPKTGVGGTRLVRAANASQARNHVARNQYHVAVASQHDLVSLVAAGVQVETAKLEQDAA